MAKTLMLGKIEGRRRRGWQRLRWLDDITNSIDKSLSKLWEIVKNREAWLCHSPWGHKELEMTEQLNNNKKLLLEKTEEPEIKLPTSIGS